MHNVIKFWGKRNRSSLSQMFFKIRVHKNFANFIVKHQCWSISWTAATLLNRDSNKMFSSEICKIFKNSLFLQNVSGDSFWTNRGNLCGSLCDELMLWLFRTSLFLSNIMLNVSTKSHFNFQLYYGVLISHIMMAHFV